MRDGLTARSGRDFRKSDTRSRSGRGRGQERGATLSGLAQAFVRKNPGFVFAGCMFVAAAGAVSFNALSLQEAPHPAPLFSNAERGPSASFAAPPPPPPPAAQVERVERATPAPSQPSAPLSIADLTAPPPPPSRPVREAPSVPLDPIAALIRGEGAAATTGSITANPDPRLEAAQRALVNLGYGPLVVDGLDGPMTRDAIRRFERAQGLAVTGSLGSDTIRALSVRSGVALD